VRRNPSRIRATAKRKVLTTRSIRTPKVRAHAAIDCVQRGVVHCTLFSGCKLEFSRGGCEVGTAGGATQPRVLGKIGTNLRDLNNERGNNVLEKASCKSLRKSKVSNCRFVGESRKLEEVVS
jgi:hypothetical protein